jgi:hypothetical protein
MKSVLIAADDALKSASEAGDRTSEVDKKFREAIHILGDFEKGFPYEEPISYPNIGGTFIREEKINDGSKSPSTILYSLKQNLHSKVNFLSVSLPLNADGS